MNAGWVLLQAGVGLAVYAVACNRLSAVVQPLRLRMADMGEALLSDQRLPASARAAVEQALDGAFNPDGAWKIVAALPAAAAMVLIETITGKRRPETRIAPDLRTPYRRFQVWALLLRLCNSPLALALAVTQFVVFMLLFIPAARLLSLLSRFDPPSHLHGGNGNRRVA